MTTFLGAFPLLITESRGEPGSDPSGEECARWKGDRDDSFVGGRRAGRASPEAGREDWQEGPAVMILESVAGVVSAENVRNASGRWCSGVGFDVKMMFRGPRRPGRAEQGRTGASLLGDRPRRAAPGRGHEDRAAPDRRRREQEDRAAPDCNI
ncbi:hypothetical protein Droror1_Dr00024144 [Drosera rotundifolia]